MDHRRYKYLIWNSHWYKKNVTQSKINWNESVVTKSDAQAKEMDLSKKRKPLLEDFFPWWKTDHKN